MKISAPTLISGELTVRRFRIADSEGRFDLSGGVPATEQQKSAIVVAVSQGTVTLSGLNAGAQIEVFSLAGVAVYNAVSAGTTHSFELPSGYYIIRVDRETTLDLVL